MEQASATADGVRTLRLWGRSCRRDVSGSPAAERRTGSPLPQGRTAVRPQATTTMPTGATSHAWPPRRLSMGNPGADANRCAPTESRCSLFSYRPDHAPGAMNQVS